LNGGRRFDGHREATRRDRIDREKRAPDEFWGVRFSRSIRSCSSACCAGRSVEPAHISV